jgi:Flp pilus assembly protein TadD
MSEGRRHIAAWVSAAALVAILAYAATLAHGFAFDDGIVIERNRLIRSLSRIPDLFRGGEWAGGGLEARAYRPLASATYALNYAVGALTPWGYHLANVILHALTSAGILLLALRWRAPLAAAGLAALVFAAHPVHVEAVANIAGRKDVLATLFLVSMAIAHPWALRRRGAALAVPLLAYAAAMFSKEIGVVGLALVAAQDLLVPDERVSSTRRARITLYGGYAAALALYLVAYARALGGIGAPDAVPFVDNPAAHAGTAARLLTGAAVLWKGLALQLLPIRLSPDYSYDAIPIAASALDPRAIAAVLAFVAWGAAGIRLRRRVPAVLLGLVWYLIPLLPASNLPFAVGTIFGERLLYAPSIGFAIVAALALDAALARAAPRARVAVAAGLALVLGAATVRYAATWASDATLFTAAARSVPRSAKVQVKLAEVALVGRRPADALAHAEAALAILPNLERVRPLVARALAAMDRLPDAVAVAREELRMRPHDPDALYVMGTLLRDQGQIDEAAGTWRRAIGESPPHSGAYADLCTLHLMRGESALAEELCDAAVAADERQANAWYNLGLMRGARGDRRGSRSAFEQFLASAGPEYAVEAEGVRRSLATGEH